MNKRLKLSVIGVAFAASVAIANVNIAHAGAGATGHGHGGGHGNMMTKIGAPGEAGDVTRTITVTMFDNYYEPENLNIEAGETVKFIIKNAGELVHEFNIATAAMHKAHAPEMMMMMEHGVLEGDRINWDAAKKMQASMGHGMHDEPNSVLLEPGKTGEIIWTFPDQAELEFACNVPGHYDAGMVGKVKLSH